MPSGERYTKKQIAAAIENSGGIISVIAAKLNCDWHTAKKRIQDSPELSEMYEAERHRVDDMAENTVIRDIQQGSVATAIWWLKVRRSDEFSEKTRNENYNIDLKLLTDEQLERLARGDDLRSVILESRSNPTSAKTAG